MKKYTSFDSLKRDWYTTKELFEMLEERGYAHSNQAIIRWENAGLIPKARRVEFMGKEWRVYDKDGVDFKEIIDALERQPKRIRYTI